jgi:hypothetical protein
VAQALDYDVGSGSIAGKDWCRRGESNPRPRDYETLALPLSYAGMMQFFMLRIHVRTCQGVVAEGPTTDINPSPQVTAPQFKLSWPDGC